MGQSLTIAIAVPLPADIVAWMRDADPRLTVLYEPDVLPPQRFASDHSGDPDFTLSPDGERRLRAMLAKADAWFGYPFNNLRTVTDYMSTSPNLRWIQGLAAGLGGWLERLDMPDRYLHQVTWTSAAGVHVVPLAEYAVMGALMGAKNIPSLRRDQKNKVWRKYEPVARELSQMTVTIAGMGHIGQEIARRLQPFGCRILGVNRTVRDYQGVDHCYGDDDLVEACQHTDVLINALPDTPATRHMIDEQALSHLRPAATVVSLGRGTVIDEDALVRYLNNGHIGLAVMDVFDKEPLPKTSALWTMDNVYISPHSIALSPKEDQRLAELMVDNAQRLLDNKPLRNVIDLKEFY